MRIKFQNRYQEQFLILKNSISIKILKSRKMRVLGSYPRLFNIYNMRNMNLDRVEIKTINIFSYNSTIDTHFSNGVSPISSAVFEGSVY